MTDVDVWYCKLERLCAYSSDSFQAGELTVVVCLGGARVWMRGIMRIGNNTSRQVEEEQRYSIESTTEEYDSRDTFSVS